MHASSAPPGPKPDTTEQVVTQETVPTTKPAPAETKAAEPAAAPEEKPPITAAESHRAQIEKAKVLFAKYNMTWEEGEWTMPFRGDFARVEKKVRVRIRRHCHRCQTSFGAEKLCNSCGHTRCKKCPRTSTSSRRDAKGKHSITTGSIVVDDPHKALFSLDPLTMPYRSNVKELPTPHSHRRICHKCQTAFVGAAPQCGQCGHTHCAQCPRDP